MLDGTIGDLIPTYISPSTAATATMQAYNMKTNTLSPQDVEGFQSDSEILYTHIKGGKHRMMLKNRQYPGRSGYTTPKVHINCELCQSNHEGSRHNEHQKVTRYLWPLYHCYSLIQWRPRSSWIYFPFQSTHPNHPGMWAWYTSIHNWAMVISV